MSKKGENMEKKAITCGQYKVTLYIPEGRTPMPVVYSNMFGDEADETAHFLYEDGEPAQCVLAAISGGDWDKDLSPWPAGRAFKGGADFGGGADDYLKELTDRIIPAVNGELTFAPLYNCIAGYSLAGMFSLYAVYRTDVFRRGASASGSLWFDKLIDVLRKEPPVKSPEKFYFSLGDKEKNTKNQRMAVVEDRTEEAFGLMRGLGVDTIFESNPGGHFNEPEKRMAKGIKWMLK